MCEVELKNMNDNLYKAMNENDMIYRMREAAERGDAEAAADLGVSYMRGEGVERNQGEAVKRP